MYEWVHLTSCFGKSCFTSSGPFKCYLMHWIGGGGYIDQHGSVVVSIYLLHRLAVMLLAWQSYGFDTTTRTRHVNVLCKNLALTIGDSVSG